MTPPPVAKVAALTSEEPGAYFVTLAFEAGQPRILDVAVDGSWSQKFRITKQQLAGILEDSAKMMARGASHES